ncbi:PhzF family phenazine biosynthesis protein [Thalassolituus sp. LLYu03]|uniref:PhzF family phenazine biosynthesis protein n=1 Tax=Thalassolituus sp. LLYu03 TaxID=3421656 RepID=UPI003D282838
MQLPMYQVDAFTRRTATSFSGNPAAVVPLQRWLSDEVMQAIAAENNLSETAFFVKENDVYHIRWFTPTTEVDLCGHATLASAWVIVSELGDERAELPFRCGIGDLSVSRDTETPDNSNQRLWLNFPQRAAERPATPDQMALLSRALGQSVVHAQQARDLVVELADEDAVIHCQPDFAALAELDVFAVTITAKARTAGYDFVSRFFAPRQGINEDPVTGSSFCTLAPYWHTKSGLRQMTAWQCSNRGGDVSLQLTDDRVHIGGHCFLFLRGTITLPG